MDLELPSETEETPAPPAPVLPTAQWRQPNERRPTIAQDLKLPRALFTHREPSAKLLKFHDGWLGQVLGIAEE